MAADGTSTQLIGLLDYLAAREALERPPVTDIESYGVLRRTAADLPDSPYVRLTPAAEGEWLSVDFVDLPPAPPVPADLVALLGPRTALSHHRPPVIRAPEPRTTIDEEGTVRVDEDDAARIAALVERPTRWITETWQAWSDEYRHRDSVKALHRALFDLHGRLAAERESFELVWGFGRLVWDPRFAGKVDHPIITVPVEIQLDQRTNQLTVGPTDPPAAETLFLAGVAKRDDIGFASLASAVAEDDGFDPWSASSLLDVARRYVRCLSDEGTVVDAAPGRATEIPVVSTEWTLFVRRREPDYLGFIRSMRELYEGSAEVPDAIRHIVSAPVVPDAVAGSNGSGGSSWNGVPAEELLLPLASNADQERIVRLAQVNPGVTVQGPPGTGKSHTIANLISHYVSLGQRVLVVAEKEQALRVLRDKVPAGLRALAVSVLGSDAESRRELEASIQTIQSKVGSLNPEAENTRIHGLLSRLEANGRDIARAKNLLLTSRRAETTTLPGSWLAGPDLTPSAAAAWIARQPAVVRIPDQLGPEAGCPLSGDDLGELVGLLRRLGKDAAREAVGTLPDPAALPRVSLLADRCSRAAELRSALGEAGIARLDASTLGMLEMAVVEQLAQGLASFVAWSDEHAGDWASEIAGQSLDAVLSAGWHQTIESVLQLRMSIAAHSVELASHEVKLPETMDPAVVGVLQEAARRIADKGKLGMFDKDLKRAVESVQVDGRTPTTEEQVMTAARAAQRAIERSQLVRLWNNRIGEHRGPTLGTAHPETEITRHLEALERAVGLRAEWQRIRESAGSLAPHLPIAPSRAGAADALDVASVAANGLELNAIEAELAEVEDDLRRGSTTSGASPLFGRLAEAVRSRDVDGYATHLGRTGELAAIAADARRLWDLHTRLEEVAPRWASELVDDPARAGDPTQLRTAWEARQLDVWVGSVLELADPATIQRHLDQLGADRRRLIEDIVTTRAWCRLATQLTQQHREALTTYVLAVKSFGKTGGKFRDKKQRAIREAFDSAKLATPVWIMTANEALRSFTHSDPPPFDVLIVDEASQLELRSLPLLALARRAIVVGDDQQTSPPVVGLSQEPVYGLISTHLAGIPNAQVLFAPGRSLYDTASAKFGEVVTLTEHFRCLPQIIEFSNQHFYDGAITPLRDRPPQPGWQPIAAQFVMNGYREGSVNRAEAEWILQKITEMLGDPRYDAMTFGVVSLLSGQSGKQNQAQFIRDLIYDKLGPEVINKRKIRVGTGPEFQGDERDVMFLSCVVGHDAELGIGKARAQTTVPFRQAMNVSASRARNQMWVVHSLPAEAFGPDDLRGALIRHCTTTTVAEETGKRLGDRCESNFERAVVQRVLDRGYERVRVQYPVSRFSIDIVVEGDEGRLAIECDGDRWHGEEAWQRDCERQEILERAGWTFARIRGSAFYRDPDAALVPLWERLEELGIRPGGSEPAVVVLPPPVGRSVETVASAPVANTWAPPPPPPPPLAVVGPVSAHRHDTPNPGPLLVTDVEESPNAEGIEDDLDEDTADDEAADVGSVHGPAPDVAPRTWSLHRSRQPVDPVVEMAKRPASVPAPVPSRSSAPRPLVSAGPASIALAAYRESELGTLRSVVGSSKAYIIRGLTEVVEAEGPVIAEVAYRRYNRAAGGLKLGKVVKTELNGAMADAIRSGVLAQLEDDRSSLMSKTIYLPGTEPVVPRVLGPRSFVEVPLSELRTVAEHLRIENVWSPEWRRILHLYGLSKLTPTETSYLERALSYGWCT